MKELVILAVVLALAYIIINVTADCVSILGNNLCVVRIK